jgi:hypothetical protein
LLGFVVSFANVSNPTVAFTKSLRISLFSRLEEKARKKRSVSGGGENPCRLGSGEKRNRDEAEKQRAMKIQNIAR